MVPRRLAKVASLGPREAVAENGAIAGDAAIAERAYCAVVTLRSRLTEVAVVIGCSLSSPLVPYVAYPRPGWHKDAADNVAEANSKARDNWWMLHSDCNNLHRPATRPALVLQANSESVLAVAVAVDPRSMMRAS